VVNQANTLARLNKEKDYEEKIVRDLGYFIIDEIQNLRDLTEEEKQKVTENMTVITLESAKHSFLFNQLVQMVMEDKSDKF
jgi:hypothetical protein